MIASNVTSNSVTVYTVYRNWQYVTTKDFIIDMTGAYVSVRATGKGVSAQAAEYFTGSFVVNKSYNATTGILSLNFLYQAWSKNQTYYSWAGTFYGNVNVYVLDRFYF